MGQRWWRPTLHSATIFKFGKIYLPIDVRVKNGAEVTMKHPDKLKRDDNILDVGLDSVEQFSKLLATLN